MTDSKPRSTDDRADNLARLEPYERVRLEGPDQYGTLRGKVVTPAKAANPNGCNIANVIMGLSVADELFENDFAAPFTGYEDILMVPDFDTLCRIPWEPETAAVLADYRMKDGSPHPTCMRELVRKAERRLAKLGLEGRVGIEFEFWLFRAESEEEDGSRDYGQLPPVSRLIQCYSLQRWPELSGFFTELWESLEVLGVPIEGVHTEWGRSAMEVVLKATTPLKAADNAARFKSACREIADRHGLAVSFMAKISHEEAGASGHIHQSVLRDGEPVFWSAQNELSPLGQSFLEGVLRASSDLAALMLPNVNSYRRPDPEFWVATSADWGYDDRLALCRVMADVPDACRIEHRLPGADLAIHLAVAGCLFAGAWGIEEEFSLREPRSRAKDAKPAGERIPSTLREATEVLRGSKLARELLGTEVVEWYLTSCDSELRTVDEQLKRIPAWELERYFETA